MASSSSHAGGLPSSITDTISRLSSTDRIQAIERLNLACRCKTFTNSVEQGNRGMCKHIVAVLRHLGYPVEYPPELGLKSLVDPSEGRVEDYATHELGHDRLVGKKHTMGNFNEYDKDGLPDGLRDRQERELSALFKKDVRLKPLKRNG